jgi:hypothetical protein
MWEPRCLTTLRAFAACCRDSVTFFVCGRKRTWPNMRYEPDICLDGVSGTTEPQSEPFPGSRFEPVASRMWSNVLPTPPRCSGLNGILSTYCTPLKYCILLYLSVFVDVKWHGCWWSQELKFSLLFSAPFTQVPLRFDLPKNMRTRVKKSHSC